MEAFERTYLSRLLERTGGRVGETARLAGISERSLYDLMRRSGLRKEDFREHRRDAAERDTPEAQTSDFLGDVRSNRDDLQTPKSIPNSSMY